MLDLLRLAGWGVAATAALLVAVVTANSTGGQQRLSAAFAGVSGTGQAETAKTEAALLARLGANESDTRRLVEMVRSLAGDRERLMNRVTVLERSLEDITGTIQRQAALTPPAATPPSVPSGTPQLPATATPPKSTPAEPGGSAGATPEPPKRPANAPGTVPDLQAVEARPAAGVEVGGARDFDGLRTLWTSLSATHPDLFEGLQPIVTVREDGRSRSADLRLVAGPLTDVDSASRICSTLAAAKRYCRLVAFEGQPLALNAPPAQPRRPATAPKPRPTAKAAP
jgi:hypothetical protein